MVVLSDVIGTIESVRFQYAVRFERRTFEKFVDNRAVTFQRPWAQRAYRANKLSSPDSALMIGATSWGMFQMMGFNLYSVEYQYEKPVGAFLNDVAAQVAAFEKFVTLNHINFTVDELEADKVKRETFARAYNGPANVADYAPKIYNAIRYLRGLEPK